MRMNHIKQLLSGKWYLLVLICLTAVIALYSPLNPFSGQAITTDQAVFLTIAQGIQNGQLAYVDFFDHKGPLLYLLLSFGLSFGKSLVGNFVIEVIVIFCSVYFLYRIGALLTDSWSALIATVLIFLSDITLFTTSNSEEYIFPLLCMSMYLWLLQVKQGIQYSRVFYIGLCGMLVFFIKYNYCLIWAAMGIVLFLFMIVHRYSIKKIVKMCLSFGIGMFVAVIPFGIYLLVTGSFSAFMEAYVLYSLHYAEATGARERFSCIRFLLNTPLCIFFIVCGIAVMVLSCYILISQKKEILGITRNTLECMVGFYLLSAAIVITTASPGQSWYYYKQTTMIIYILPIAILLYLFWKLWSRKLMAGWGRIAMLGLTALLLYFIPNREDFLLREDLRFQSAQTIAALVDENCSDEDTMISFSNDCTMYFLSDCNVASRIFFPSATIVDDALIDELMTDLENNRPKIITFQSDWKAGLSQRMIDEAITFTNDNYSLLYSDEFRSVYLRKR